MKKKLSFFIDLFERLKKIRNGLFTNEKRTRPSLLPGTLFLLSKLYGVAKILLGSNKSYAVQLDSLSAKVTKLGIFLNKILFLRECLRILKRKFSIRSVPLIYIYLMILLIRNYQKLLPGETKMYFHAG